MSEYSRSSATFKNYAISLGIIIAIVLVLAFVVSTRSGENIPSVDYRPEAEVLRGNADYPVTVPADDLAEQGWTPTSSTLETEGPVEWSVGFATAADSHVMFTQSDGDPDAVVAERSKGAEETGTVAVGGREWEHHESEDWSALVLREDGYTLVVAGPADLDELAHFADGLETDEDAGDGADDGADGGGEASAEPTEGS